MNLLLVLSLSWSQGDLRLLETYENPADEPLKLPYAMAFSPEGRLFVADRGHGRIYVWNQKARFEHRFDAKEDPMQLCATSEEVFVWESGGSISVYGHDGGFKRGIPVGPVVPRRFAVLDSVLLLGYQKEVSGGEMRMIFETRKGDGELADRWLDVKNEGYLFRGQGANNVSIKAFSPELDIQRAGSDTWYAGFSQEPSLFRLDGKGNIQGVQTYEIPVSKPDEDDRAQVMAMEFTMPNGDKIKVSQLPHVNFVFGYDKAHYTQFHIVGKKIAFVLTPIGSTEGVGLGYYKATYCVNDLESGRLLDRGGYELERDSVVLFRDGRALAFVAQGEGGFQVRAAALTGLEP